MTAKFMTCLLPKLKKLTTYCYRASSHPMFNRNAKSAHLLFFKARKEDVYCISSRKSSVDSISGTLSSISTKSSKKSYVE